MATVYLAQDLKHDRKVAIKVLRPELGASLGPERFLQEIRLAAKLQHPHIVGLLDSGVTAAGPGSEVLSYYVMPFVEGETLRERLARTGPLAVPEVVRLTGRGRRRARQGPQGRDSPPRHQAGEHTPRRRPRTGDGFRHRQGGERRRRPARADQCRPVARHAGLHGAGAGGRRSAHRSSGRSLQPGAGGVRDARWWLALRGHHPAAANGGAPHPSAAADPPKAPRLPPRPGGAGHAVPLEEPRRALAVGGRCPHPARGRRDDDPPPCVVVDTTARRASSSGRSSSSSR